MSASRGSRDNRRPSTGDTDHATARSSERGSDGREDMDLSSRNAHYAGDRHGSINRGQTATESKVSQEWKLWKIAHAKVKSIESDYDAGEAQMEWGKALLSYGGDRFPAGRAIYTEGFTRTSAAYRILQMARNELEEARSAYLAYEYRNRDDNREYGTSSSRPEASSGASSRRPEDRYNDRRERSPENRSRYSSSQPFSDSERDQTQHSSQSVQPSSRVNEFPTFKVDTPDPQSLRGRGQGRDKVQSSRASEGKGFRAVVGQPGRQKGPQRPAQMEDSGRGRDFQRGRKGPSKDPEVKVEAGDPEVKVEAGDAEVKIEADDPVVKLESPDGMRGRDNRNGRGGNSENPAIKRESTD